jgi:hypothetical protein
MPSVRPVVETEERITRFIPPNNGAGPLWCYGSPTIVRDGGQLFVSIPETDPGLARLCKTRWQLWRRDASGWDVVQHAPHFDEREPCPLVRLPGGRLLLSVNPLKDRSIAQGGGPCTPHLLEFSSRDPSRPPEPRMPAWDRPYDSFCEHSYRGIGVNYDRQMALLLNIDGHNGYAWSLMKTPGVWPHQGAFRFPIRACYPQVGLRNGAAHVLAVGDIVEPNPDWRAYKKEKTGSGWDYDFRRLFYTWTPDIRTTPFQPPVEVASHDATAGHIRNADLWIDPEGAAHLLYTTKNIWHDGMRDRFFPGRPIVSTLEYRVLKEGRIVRSHTLTSHVKDERDMAPSGLWYTGAAFHAHPSGALRVVFAAAGDGMYVMQAHPWIGDTPARLPLATPLADFFIPTPRAGSETTEMIDLYGTCPGSDGLYYARVRG